MSNRTRCLLSLCLALTLLCGAARCDLNDGLTHWWSLDEGNSPFIDSVGGADATCTNCPTSVAGLAGGAVLFDGVDDEVQAEHPDKWDWAADSSFTLAYWTQTEPGLASSANNMVALARQGTANQLHWWVGCWSGSWQATFWLLDTNRNGPTGITAGPALNDGGWHMVTAVRDGAANENRLYVDGQSVGTAQWTYTAGFDEDVPFMIGHIVLGGHNYRYRGILDEIVVWERALSDVEVTKAMAGLADPSVAQGPNPEDSAIDVPLDILLGWTPGEFAAAHDVYFGTSFDDVNDATRTDPMDVLASQGQTAATYDPPGVLGFSQTYYWRIDEVNAAPDNTIFKGRVWSFTTETFAYAIETVTATSNGTSEEGAEPQKTVDGSGINADDHHSIAATDMWLAYPPADEPLWIQYDLGKVYKLHEMLVWNYNVQFELVLGFGLKGVTVEYSQNATDWTAMGDVEFARATAKATYAANTTVDFGGVPVKYVRLNVNSGYGLMGQYGLSEVRFLYIPAQAREPKPDDGAADVAIDTVLSWRSGREAVSHQVLLGTDPAALTLAGSVDSPTFAPEGIEFGSTYYWRIVEVNEADAVSAWAGEVWSFSTQEYALIDGFETYNDDIEAGTTIFDTWIDGWVNDTGSTVGYFDAPFAEKTIVHGGKQSMPLQYDNSVSPFYSEAEREFETAQNWTGNGADMLVLYVRGNAPAFQEAADGSIIMSAIGTDIWDVSDQFRYAYKNLSGNGSMTVRVDSVVRSNEWAKAGVMIRETLDPSSPHAFVAVTPEPTHGISFQRRPAAGQASANTDVANIEMPHWVRLTRTGNVFTAQQSTDGVTWVDITPAAPVSIPMAANVYIGLAVTSHDAAISTAAEFSNVSTTGNVTGAWQTADIGVAQPTGNSAESMYVTIEDSAGKTKTVVNADAAITTRPTWQEWAIPYSDLNGVNLSRVQKMTIGVGSSTSPSPGGTGVVYIDDIGFGRPTTTQ